MNILIYLLLDAAIYINLRAAYSTSETLNCMHLKVTVLYCDSPQLPIEEDLGIAVVCGQIMNWH